MRNIEDIRARASWNLPIRISEEIRRLAQLEEGRNYGNTSRMAEKIILLGLEAYRSSPLPPDAA